MSLPSLRAAIPCLLLALAPAPGVHAGEKVTLPNPWHAGQTYDYATSWVQDIRSVDGVHSLQDSTGFATLTIARAGPEGAHQQWRYRGRSTTVLDGEPEGQAIFLAALDAMDDTGIDVAIDAQGAYVRVENADAIGSAMRTRVRPAVLAMIDDQLRSLAPPERESRRRALEADVDANLAKGTTTQALEEVFRSEFQPINRFIARQLEPGIGASSEDVLDTPKGDDPLPAILEYVLLRPAAGDRDVAIEWTKHPDAVAAHDALWTLHDAMTGSATPTDSRRGLPEGIDLAEHGIVHIDRMTGALESFEQTKHETFDGRTRIEHTTLRRIGPAPTPDPRAR